MKNLYVVSMNDAQGRMQSYGIVASTRILAEAEARRLAGVAVDAEPNTSQNLHVVNSVVD